MDTNTSCTVGRLHTATTTAGKHDEITLLGLWASPFVIRARIVLNLKGLAYSYTDEDLYSKSELLVRSNPVHKKVPVLIHNGKPVSESNIIVQYLEEAFPASDDSGAAPILPADPYNRAVARFWASYVDDKVFGTWLRVSHGRTNEERVEAARQVVAVLQTLEKEAASLLGGDTVGLVDVVLGSLLGWLHATEAICGVKVIDGAKMPVLAAWAERFQELDGVKGLIPEAKRLVEYNIVRRARLGLPMLSPYAEWQQK